MKDLWILQLKNHTRPLGWGCMEPSYLRSHVPSTPTKWDRSDKLQRTHLRFTTCLRPRGSFL